MGTLTEDLQSGVRLTTGTQYTLNGDLHAYLDTLAIPAGQLNERMIAYVSTLDPTITNASSALNYALMNPQNFISPLASATFFIPLTSSLALSKGAGVATFTRATTATVVDFEGNVRLCKAGEARFLGVRRVANFALYSDGVVANYPVSGGTFSQAATPISGFNNSVYVQPNVTTGTYVYVGTGTSILPYRVIRFSAYIKMDSGLAPITGLANSVGNDFSVNIGGMLVASDSAISLGGGIYLVSAITTIGAVVSGQWCGIWKQPAQSLNPFKITGYMIEDVTDQSVQTASQYVPSTENSTGAGGVKYFETNYAGNPIPDTTLKGYISEGPATNLFLNSAVGVTQTTPALTAASYTLSFKGTGSIVAAGGFVGTLAGTGATNRVSLTVTATALSAVLTVTGSITEVQLELGAFASSYIPTTTVAVTRNADGDACPAAGNISTSGSVYLEFTPSHTPSGTIALWGSYTDANNSVSILHDATNLIMRKRVAGVNYDSTQALAFAAGTTYKIAARFGTSGQRVALNGALGTANADAVAAPIAATMQWGSNGNNGQQPTANIRNARCFAVLTDAQLVQITS